MGLYLQNGTRVTRGSFPSAADPDPVHIVSQDIDAKIPYTYEKGPEHGPNATTEGGWKTLTIRAGSRMRVSEIDRLFPQAVVDSVSPATGGTAGGTVITIKGSYLDGATGVTVGGTPATGLTKISPSEIRVTAPAHAAGLVNVVVTTDAATPATKNNAFTYA